jgi:hypothetical protein
MAEPVPKDKDQQKTSAKAPTPLDDATKGLEEIIPLKGAARRSGLTDTMNTQEVLDRILNTEISLSL